MRSLVPSVATAKTLWALLLIVIFLAAATNFVEAIPIQDGGSYSGQVALADLKAMEGSIMTTNTYDITSTAGFTCTNNCFTSSLILGDYLWMIPSTTPLAVVRVHKTTGVMTSFSGWPGALMPITSNAFGGVAHDPVRDRLWFVPSSGANNVVYMDVNTQIMGYCSTSWPAGVGTAAFRGGFVEGANYLWLAPFRASRVVRVDMSDCSMTGYDPTSAATLNSYPFHGGVFDGVRYGWFVPMRASHAVKVDTTDGSMVGFNTWPGGFVGGTWMLTGGTFDGQSIWLAPYQANMIVKVDKDSGAMIGFNSWPLGFSLPSYAFNAAAYDGRYVWFTPYQATHLLRVEVSSGTIAGFDNWPTGLGLGSGVGPPWQTTYAAALDPATGTMWLSPYGPTQQLVQVVFVPPTATKTKTQDPPVTKTAAPTVTPTVPSTVAPTTTTTTLVPTTTTTTTAVQTTTTLAPTATTTAPTTTSAPATTTAVPATSPATPIATRSTTIAPPTASTAVSTATVAAPTPTASRNNGIFTKADGSLAALSWILIILLVGVVLHVVLIGVYNVVQRHKNKGTEGDAYQRTEETEGEEMEGTA